MTWLSVAFRLHWRLMLGLAASLLVWLLAPLIIGQGTACFLVGWDCGALVYLVLSWWLFVTAGDEEVKTRAAAEDEPPLALLALVICAVIAGLVGIILTLSAAHRAGGGAKASAAILAAMSLILSWLMLQTVFVLHYAHRYFGDSDGDGEINGGFAFPGEPAATYMDFVYLSICIGATFQVSDTNVLQRKLRNLITAHAAVAYIYNTAVLALGISLIGSLIGG